MSVTGELQDAMVVAEAEQQGSQELIKYTMPDDGREVTFTRPSAGAFAMASARFSGGSTSVQSAGAIINFLFSMLDQEDSGYFEARLMASPRAGKGQPKPLDIEAIDELVKWIIGEWSGRPTT